MSEYRSRLELFLLTSIESLRNQSGVQRWYLICEDVQNLYIEFQQSISVSTLSPETFFHLLTEPFSTDLQAFQKQLEHPEFQSFMFIVLQALLDPPASWWKETQAHLNKSQDLFHR
jgi:hypothetical protein